MQIYPFFSFVISHSPDPSPLSGSRADRGWCSIPAWFRSRLRSRSSRGLSSANWSSLFSSILPTTLRVSLLPDGREGHPAWQAIGKRGQAVGKQLVKAGGDYVRGELSLMYAGEFARNALVENSRLYNFEAATKHVAWSCGEAIVKRS